MSDSDEEVAVDLAEYKAQFRDASDELDLEHNPLLASEAPVEESTEINVWKTKYERARELALKLKDALLANRNTVAIAANAAIEARKQQHEFRAAVKHAERSASNYEDLRRKFMSQIDDVEKAQKESEEWKSKYYEELEIELELEEERKEKEEMKEMYEALIETERNHLREVKTLLLQKQDSERNLLQLQDEEDELNKVQEANSQLQKEAAEWKARFKALQERRERHNHSDEVRKASIVQIMSHMEAEIDPAAVSSRVRGVSRAHAPPGGLLRSRLHSAREELKKNQAYIQQKTLLANRLRASREELKANKLHYEAEVKQLKMLLVATQVELARLQGEANSRKNLIATAQQLLGSLKPWVGIEIPRDREDGDDDGGEEEKEIRVVRTKLSSPAEQAGLRKGDVIELVDGEEVASKQILRNLIMSVIPGDLVTFQVRRNNAIEFLELQIGTKGVFFDLVVELRRIAAGIVKKGDEGTILAIKNAKKTVKRRTKRTSGSTIHSITKSS